MQIARLTYRMILECGANEDAMGMILLSKIVILVFVFMGEFVDEFELPLQVFHSQLVNIYLNSYSVRRSFIKSYYLLVLTWMDSRISNFCLSYPPPAENATFICEWDWFVGECE